MHPPHTYDFWMTIENDEKQLNNKPILSILIQNILKNYTQTAKQLELHPLQIQFSAQNLTQVSVSDRNARTDKQTDYTLKENLFRPSGRCPKPLTELNRFTLSAQMTLHCNVKWEISAQRKWWIELKYKNRLWSPRTSLNHFDGLIFLYLLS